MPDDARQPKSTHEQFVVDSRRGGAQLLRQDRFEPAQWSCRLVLGDREHIVANYSAFGLAVVAAHAVEHDDALTASLILHDVEVARLRLRRVRVEALADGRCKTAFAIVGEPLSLNRLDALVRAHDAVVEHGELVARAQAVPAPFRAKVYEIKDALEELEQLVERLAPSAAASGDEQREFERTVATVVASRLDRLFAGAYDELVDVVGALDAEEVQRCHAFFRDKLRRLLYQSPLFERSYEKPLGYAGDFEMMSLVYRNEELGRSRFARCLSRYYIDHPNARAVKNRAVYLHGRIKELLAGGKPLRILSVASGPAQEIQMLLEDAELDASRVEIDLLDQDISALRAAQLQIRRITERRGIAPRIRFLHKAMANVIKGGLDGEYDLVYSAGLFDYFSDPLARRAATRLYALLAEGGQLVIGNFRAVAQNRAFMELALDWDLIYRSEEELRALYDGIAQGLRVDAEPEQINLFVNLGR
jgi:extracellular factor (EF) 3-hydroxypalmitic acid methyl ester biosynthesis protein